MRSVVGRTFANSPRSSCIRFQVCFFTEIACASVHVPRLATNTLPSVQFDSSVCVLLGLIISVVTRTVCSLVDSIVTSADFHYTCMVIREDAKQGMAKNPFMLTRTGVTVVIGGISGAFGTVCGQPLDAVKVRDYCSSRIFPPRCWSKFQLNSNMRTDSEMCSFS